MFGLSDLAKERLIIQSLKPLKFVKFRILSAVMPVANIRWNEYDPAGLYKFTLPRQITLQGFALSVNLQRATTGENVSGFFSARWARMGLFLKDSAGKNISLPQGTATVENGVGTAQFDKSIVVGLDHTLWVPNFENVDIIQVYGWGASWSGDPDTVGADTKVILNLITYYTDTSKDLGSGG